MSGGAERAPAVVAQRRAPRRRSRASFVVTAPPSPVVTILRGWKLRQPSDAEPAARAAAVARAERARGVLEQRQSSGSSSTGAGPPKRCTASTAFVRGPTLDLRRVDVHRLRVDVDEHRLQPGERDDVRGRRERVGGDEHLVARARARARAPRGGARPCPTRRRARARPRTRRASSASNSATFGPIVSMPLSRTSATSASSARRRRRASARRMRASSPGTTRSSSRGRRRARPRLPAEQLARLLDVRDAQLDVGVVQRLEHDLARARR